jgi:thioredoxin 1
MLVGNLPASEPRSPEETMPELLHLTDQSFDVEVLQAETPVLVDFWAEWCAPCRMVAPVVEQINEDYNGEIKVCKLDVDSAPVISAQLGVLSIPTLILFKDGKAVQRMVGFQPKPSLKSKIDAALATV